MMAGAYIAYTLEMDEVVAREALGVVSEIDVETTPTGVGQEMPSLDY
jgi:hypothetical protein